MSNFFFNFKLQSSVNFSCGSWRLHFGILNICGSLVNVIYKQATPLVTCTNFSKLSHVQVEIMSHLGIFCPFHCRTKSHSGISSVSHDQDFHACMHVMLLDKSSGQKKRKEVYKAHQLNLTPQHDTKLV